jgi:hypothetical protein
VHDKGLRGDRVSRRGAIVITSSAVAVAAGVLAAIPVQAATSQPGTAASAAVVQPPGHSHSNHHRFHSQHSHHGHYSHHYSHHAPHGRDPRADDPRAKCAQPAQPGQMACFALLLTATHARPGAATPQMPAGFGPTTLQHAYNLKASRGSGRTVAIVDAYDDPDAESDLATYRSNYSLPACTTANGCFRKADENGGTSYPKGDPGWAAEISLDLDMVSAICPNCHILLVEASSSYISDLGKAVNTAVSLGARFVSNSYGGDESSSDSSYDNLYYNHPGVAITASAGDSGYGVSYPAASQYVTSVGGTSLKPGSTPRGWTETAWGGGSDGGTGSGCSADDTKPSWQKDTGCAKRTVADASAVADPSTGVAVYDTYQSNGWAVYGGTSVASPIIAAVYALAGTPTRSSYPASYPYARTSALNDVTSGENGSCSPSYLCTAGPGYDGPTGLGTPDGYTAFAAP